jgi:pyridoxal phosphate enzyme (YggS family)
MSRESEILENLARVRSEIPSGVTLIVVTKTYPISDIEILYSAGIRDFGENRDHEGAQKAPALPDDANWHFQGQIQSNKLKSIVGWADYIHSLDDLGHAKKINKLVEKPKDVFIQVSLDGQENRGGLAPENLSEFLDQLERLPMVNPIGLMAVAPLNEEPNLAFARLAEIKANISREFPAIKFLSAGMSSDYKAGLKHGATHIRVGSSILGSRS